MTAQGQISAMPHPTAIAVAAPVAVGVARPAAAPVALAHLSGSMPNAAVPVAPAARGATIATLAPPRAEGAARIEVFSEAGRTRLRDFRQQGSLRLLWPRSTGRPLTVVTLNTAGGLTGGDRMDLVAEAGAGSDLEITSQAAERAYRAEPGSRARVNTRLQVGPGARLDWLPQETILFNGAALERCLTVDLAGDARALIVEPLVFGRRAMGERLTRLDLSDRWEIRRDGRRLMVDSLRFSGDAETHLDRPGAGNGARAMASFLLVAPGGEAVLPRLRALLPDTATAGAGLLRPDAIFGRILAPDGHDLRRLLMPVLTLLSGRTLPRLWMM